jgi:hypothetical protein
MQHERQHFLNKSFSDVDQQNLIKNLYVNANIDHYVIQRLPLSTIFTKLNRKMNNLIKS